MLTASLLEQEDDALETLAGKAGQSLAGETEAPKTVIDTEVVAKLSPLEQR